MSCILEGFVMVYRVLSYTIGNQGSNGSCQLSGPCLDYGATLLVFSGGAVVFSC